MEAEYAGAEAAKPLDARRTLGREELWLSILSFGRVHLGMTFDEVMECTPRYFDALCQRWRDEIERAERAQEFMLAQLTAAVCNFSFAGCKQPKKPKDFMPSEWREEAKTNPVTKPRKLTKRAKEKRQHEFGEQLRRTMMAAFGE